MADDVPAVLFAATSANKLGSMDTGCWLEEMAAPYYILKKRGFEPTIASPAGGKIPLDPRSTQEGQLSATSKNFLKDNEAMDKLNNSVRTSEVDPDDFVALFVPGGHGIMVDGPKDMKPLVETFAKQGKLVSAVCHGPAAFTEAELDGQPIVKGKKVTSFSNSEEEKIGGTKAVPFLLEDRLKERGAHYHKGEDWSPFVVTDSKMITGQNPQVIPLTLLAIGTPMGAASP
ncbi:hypothetical protein CVIRNUC_008593 [Coccomyxa viridis]|uniref:DJ-1/PfpI domain-containing protein n=1 Tax=Coccomyxa viridis TaxID=1274662 RepID=A0AAV1IGP5_9CHLO|nr:hypothetical protein CVIRNUC_008593 [Coccomyxa viridis]